MDLQDELTSREGRGGGMVSKFGMDMYTRLHLKWITNKDLHRELCSMCGGSLDGRRVWGRVETCIPAAESLCYPPETITTFFISYTPMQDKKFEKKKRIIQKIITGV